MTKKYVVGTQKNCLNETVLLSTNDFICELGKLPFPSHLGKCIIKNGKISTKIHEIVKIKAIFGQIGNDSHIRH